MQQYIEEMVVRCRTGNPSPSAFYNLLVNGSLEQTYRRTYVLLLQVQPVRPILVIPYMGDIRVGEVVFV